jgi:hypothetical protein
MTDLDTANGYDTAGGLAPPVTRPKDPTGASRSRRYRQRKASGADLPQHGAAQKRNDFKGRVTVGRDATVTVEKPSKSKTPFAQPRRQVANVVTYGAAICLATVGVGLSAVGMVETATYALAVGGVLFCALAVAADVLTLTMPSVVGALWHRCSPVVILAVLMWCAGAAVTVANLAGYVGEHVERYQAGRETMATGRNLAMEHLARLRDERRAIVETRPSGVISAALNDARRSERPALREALAMARRRDALDVELVAFEQRLGEIPQVATADASATVLSDISGTVRCRLAPVAAGASAWPAAVRRARAVARHRIDGRGVGATNMTSPWKLSFERLFPNKITVRPFAVRGTSHFISLDAARSCHGDTVEAKLAAGEIFVCKPMLEPGEEWVALDEGRRWGIITTRASPFTWMPRP